MTSGARWYSSRTARKRVASPFARFTRSMAYPSASVTVRVASPRALGISRLACSWAWLMVRSRSCRASFTSLKAGFTESGGVTSWSSTVTRRTPVSYSVRIFCISSFTSVETATRPTVRTSLPRRLPTTRRMTASAMSRIVCRVSRTWKRKWIGSSIRYWTIHWTSITLRSPVSMRDTSLKALSAYCVRWPAGVATVRNPNSSLRTRAVGTSRTVSIPYGSLKCRPGPTVRTTAPKRWTTPVSSGCTVNQPDQSKTTTSTTSAPAPSRQRPGPRKKSRTCSNTRSRSGAAATGPPPGSSNSYCRMACLLPMRVVCDLAGVCILSAGIVPRIGATANALPFTAPHSRAGKARLRMPVPPSALATGQRGHPLVLSHEAFPPRLGTSRPIRPRAGRPDRGRGCRRGQRFPSRSVRLRLSRRDPIARVHRGGGKTKTLRRPVQPRRVLIRGHGPR